MSIKHSLSDRLFFCFFTKNAEIVLNASILMQMLQSDWLSYQYTISHKSAVVGGRLGNGDVSFCCNRVFERIF